MPSKSSKSVAFGVRMSVADLEKVRQAIARLNEQGRDPVGPTPETTKYRRRDRRPLNVGDFVRSAVREKLAHLLRSSRRRSR